jgi:hypothetical protein
MNHRFIRQDFEGLYFNDIRIYNPTLGLNEFIYRDKEIHVVMNYDNKAKIDNLYFNIKFKDEGGRYFMVTTSSVQSSIIGYGIGKATMRIPSGFFNEGSYVIELMIIQKIDTGYKVYMHESDLLYIQILPEKREFGTWMGKEVGYIRHTFEWTK